MGKEVDPHLTRFGTAMGKDYGINFIALSYRAQRVAQDRRQQRATALLAYDILMAARRSRM